MYQVTTNGKLIATPNTLAHAQVVALQQTTTTHIHADLSYLGLRELRHVETYVRSAS